MENLSNHQKTDIGALYRRYAEEVTRFFAAYTRDLAQAQDMTQDLFVKLMGYEAMIVEETEKSFVFTIARRMIVDDARHRQFVRRAVEGLAYEQEQFWQESETLECKQLREMEVRKLRTLPKKMAEVYELTRFQELTAQEIAVRMGISKRTVEYHLLVSRRAVRQTLRRALAV
ncbi:MAG: sigma-70 family RNA polymerase sigma factor [Bacteroidaceae bacterium]|nr:sigma-70 family RNA polymerase sigma factor [Bacteroidaceae bacterium]